MDSYRATRNEESIEEVPEKTQEEKDFEANKRASQTVVKGAGAAVGAYFGGSAGAQIGSKVADVINNSEIGDKLTNAGAHIMGKANKHSIMGKQMQQGINNMNESGGFDVADKAIDSVASQGSDGATSKAADALGKAGEKKAESSISTNSSSSDFKGLTDNIMPSFGMGKMKFKIAVVGIAATFMIFMTCFSVFAQKDQQNLALTNETVLAHSSAGSKICTSTEIEQRAIIVGDSRIVGMQDAVEVTESSFIAASSQGLSWYNSTALGELESKLSENANSVIVLALGVNDLYNVDNYISAYTDLMQKYPTANIFILSVNPVDEVKASASGYSVTNADIEAFNQKIQSSFPDKYIDSYNSIKSSMNTADGLHYDSETYNNLYEYIISTISNNYNIICSIGSISSIDSTSLSGGNGNILSAGQSLLSLLGQEKIDAWSQSIKSDAQAAGIGTGGAPAMAAYGLVQGALNEGIVLPYFWGGGHGVISDGVNGSWGSGAVIGVAGSSAQPKGSIQASGLDCSGFVSWALKNGGCSNFTPILASSFKDLGPGIDASKAIVGDIAASNSHVMIILNNTGTSLVIAEAKGSSYGIIFEEYDYSHFGKYKIVSMSDYYAKNCNG